MSELRDFIKDAYKHWQQTKIQWQIGIILTIVIALISYILVFSQKDDSPIPNDVLKPVIALNTLMDARKEAPKVFGGATLLKYGENGFQFKWEKGEEGWRAVEWIFRYKNFGNKENYAIYYKGKAKKEGRVVTLNLIDDNRSFVSVHIDLSTDFTENIIYLNSINECLVIINENGNEKVISKDIDYFHFEHIEKAQLERFWESSGDNEVIFENLMIGL